jgi:hypothetical protein
VKLGRYEIQNTVQYPETKFLGGKNLKRLQEKVNKRKYSIGLKIKQPKEALLNEKNFL